MVPPRLILTLGKVGRAWLKVPHPPLLQVVRRGFFPAADSPQAAADAQGISKVGRWIPTGS